MHVIRVKTKGRDDHIVTDVPLTQEILRRFCPDAKIEETVELDMLDALNVIAEGNFHIAHLKA